MANRGGGALVHGLHAGVRRPIHDPSQRLVADRRSSPESGFIGETILGFVYLRWTVYAHPDRPSHQNRLAVARGCLLGFRGFRDFPRGRIFLRALALLAGGWWLLA